MEIQNSKLIEKIALLNEKPVTISGYILKGGDGIDDPVYLYPSLDPRCFYAFNPECVIDIITSTGKNDDRAIVLLHPNCEIDVISKERVNANELVVKARKRPCPCDTPGRDDTGVAFAEKDELRDQIIKLAEMLLAFGIDEFDCTRISSLDAFCCRAWNNLLDEVKSGGNTFDAGNRVLAECTGIG